MSINQTSLFMLPRKAIELLKMTSAKTYKTMYKGAVRRFKF